MKILFVPNSSGAISHGFPLLALSKRLNAAKNVSGFLLPQNVHKLFRMEGANVLEIAHDGIRSEMMAYHRFKPDVVIDDLSITTAIASELSGLPRVTMRRTGLFPGELHDGKTMHSGNFRADVLKNVEKMGIPAPSDFLDLVKAEAFIVPSIKTLEPVPAEFQDDTRYFYSGPLLVRDYLLKSADQPTREFGEVDGFLARHEGSSVVLITYGNIATPPSIVQMAIRRLVERRVPVISTLAIDGIPIDCARFFFYTKFLPFHRICAKVALMIHHCGSGTYQFPILYGVPSITISTGCYDRDEVGERLQALGASIHISDNGEEAEFLRQFDDAVKGFLERGSERVLRSKHVLAALRQESDRTTAAFSLNELLSTVLDRVRTRGVNPRM